MFEKRNSTNLDYLEKYYVDDIMSNFDLSEEEKRKIVTGINICYDLNEI
jgi:hypothetical protein